MAVFSRTLQDVLREQALLHGEATAVIDENGSVTYAELYNRAARVASALQNAGIGRHDKIGLLMGNRIEWLEICFGAFMVGAVVVPLSTWSTSSELSFLFDDSNIRMLFAVDQFGDRDFSDDLDAAHKSGISIVVLAQKAGQHKLYKDFPDEPLDILAPGEAASAYDDAFILYTSGSTSFPKAVRLKHYAVIENAFNIGERQGLRAGDRVFVSVPLFWAYGACNALPAGLTHAVTFVLAEKFEAGRALDIIEKEKCTAIYTLPAMTRALVRHPDFHKNRTATLRTGLTIGSEDDIFFTANDLGVREICNIYGATETCGNCAVTWHHWPLERRARVQGPMLPGQEVRFRDPQTQAIVSNGTPGLIEVRGYLTAGYTGKSISSNATAFTDDGFYCTGDMGMLDETGALVFIGRDTDMIKRAGINVSPAEIEAALQRIEGVEQAVVVGAPDVKRGEAIVAYVIAAQGFSLKAAVLLEALQSQLSKYKLPDCIAFVTSFPLTKTGKLDRKQVKAEATQLVSQNLSEKA